MKIAVQGQIIDTDTIYSISEEVYENNNNYFFDIICFNDHAIEVSIHTKDRTNNKAHNELTLLRQTAGTNATDEQMVMYNTLLKKIPIENKNKIEKMRQDIVNIWSNNQSVIPTFDIKKY